MVESITVRLATLRLWQEPARFQAYPSFLQSVDPVGEYSSMADLARQAGERRMLDDRHVKEEGITRNLGDWDRNGRGDLVWRGIGLLEKRNRNYVLSESGLALRSVYRDEPSGQRWKIMLATLILRREPRTRALVRALSSPAAELRFEAGSWFAGPHSLAVLTSDFGEFTPLAPALLGRPNIQTLLDTLGAWALGDWGSLPVHSSDVSVTYAGVRDPVLTVDDLGGALRGPFELFSALGLAEDVAGTLRWRPSAAAELLGPSCAAEFGWTTGAPDLPELVDQLVMELRADNGYLIASELRDRLAAAGVIGPDRELAALLDAGTLVLEAYDYGQSRHGEGLFGEPDKQLIKLRVRRVGVKG